MKSRISVLYQNSYLRVVVAIAIVLSSAFTYLNYPGHISWDSSVQLYEAHIGQSIDMHPPFMSMYLKMFGGGVFSSTAFIFFNYFAYFFTVLVLAKAVTIKNQALKLFFVLVILFNPAVIHYNAIVWKDVLQATFILIAIGLFIKYKLFNRDVNLFHIMSLAVLMAIVVVIKVSGVAIAMSYSLLYLSLAIYRKNWRVFLWFICSLIISLMLIKFITNHYIKPNPDQSISTAGYKFVLGYDIMGTISNSEIPVGNGPLEYNQVDYDELKKSYSTATASLLVKDKIYTELSKGDFESHLRTFLYYVTNFPLAYFRHKVNVFKNFYYPPTELYCFPLFVGVTGNPDYLDELKFPQDNGIRDTKIFSFYKIFTVMGFFQYGLYTFVAAACLIYTAYNYKFKSRYRDQFISNGVIAMQIFFMQFFYFVISLGCDFRYLYPCVILSIVGLINTASARADNTGIN